MSPEAHASRKKISVIIPVYNGERYIAKAIQSVMDQTLPPDEIIVINDGSTDGSAAVLAALAQSYPIQVYEKENGGQSSARNYGIRRAQGDLIAFLDQDDIWYPNHLQELVKPFYEEHYPKLGWTYSTIDEIGAEDELYRLDVLSYSEARHPKKSLAQCLATDMFVIPSVTLVLKQALEDVGGFDERLSGYEDDDLFLRLFAKGYGNVFINKSLGQWRIHEQSCSWESRMSKSRMIYAKKLLEQYPDSFVRGLKYRTDIILPRFIHNIFGELRRAALFNNDTYTQQMKADLAELYPYMTTYWKIKCRIMLVIVLQQPFKLATRFLAKIYWKFNPVGQT